MAFRRKLPTSAVAKEFMEATHRAPGARDVALRMKDLDNEGIWSELVFPSLGMWSSSFRTAEALREAIRVSNDWAFESLERFSRGWSPPGRSPRSTSATRCAS